MASKFHTDMNGATQQIVDYFGEAVTYTPKGGGDQSITAAVFQEQDQQRDDMGTGNKWVRRATVLIDTDDVATPAQDAIVTYNSEKWSIERIENHVHANLLHLIRAETIDRSAQGYRGGAV